jgi:geranylgeranyl pyrophosphate synthase
MKKRGGQDDIRDLRKAVDSLLHPSPPFLSDIVRHTLGGYGKKRRGRLMLLLGEFLSAPRKDLLTAAAAVEAVHLATLIHDDILDGSSCRRRRITLHRVYGMVPALLYGDILFARGVAAVNGLEKAALTSLLLETVHSLCEGEILEWRYARRFPWTEETYFRIAGLKTAALFRYCCQAPGVLAGLPPRRLRTLGRFGNALGICYQIADDCMDLQPTSSAHSKDRLSDLRNGVPNYPLLLAARSPGARREVRAAVVRTPDGVQLERVGKLVRASGAVREAAERGERILCDAARELKTIRAWGNGPGGERIAGFLEKQLAAMRAFR